MAERKQKVSIPLTVLSVLIAVIVVFPIVWMVLSSFKPSGELFSYPLHLFSQDPTVEHYASVLAGGFMGYVKNSLFLAVVGTLITLVISSMCGYALAIYRFEIKYVNLVFGVFLLGTLIPGETLTVPQFSVISALGLYNNIWGVILPVAVSYTHLDVYKRQDIGCCASVVAAGQHGHIDAVAPRVQLLPPAVIVQHVVSYAKQLHQYFSTPMYRREEIGCPIA